MILKQKESYSSKRRYVYQQRLVKRCIIMEYQLSPFSVLPVKSSYVERTTLPSVSLSV